jgi:hypothetical protein
MIATNSKGKPILLGKVGKILKNKKESCPFSFIGRF